MQSRDAASAGNDVIKHLPVSVASFVEVQLVYRCPESSRHFRHVAASLKTIIYTVAVGSSSAAEQCTIKRKTQLQPIIQE